MNNAVEIRGLCKKYNDFELKDIDISLPAGYIMGFVGENGAGKTTTIKALTGLIKADGGDVRIFGEKISCAEMQHREHIGVVMDRFGLPGEACISDIDSIMRNIYNTWSSRRFFDYMDSFGLPEGKKVKAFSKGMQMKLSIATALAHDSRLLILDEAASGLDPVARDQLLDILRDFIQDEEHSIFISSHILSDLEKICDYITFIHNGKIVFSREKDMLEESYGIVRCSREDMDSIDESAVIAARTTDFGIEVLVERQKVNPGLITDKATIEDIMVMMIKEK